MTAVYFFTLACLVVGGYFLAARRARALKTASGQLIHSLPAYHGMLAAVAFMVPAVLIYMIGMPIVKQFATSSIYTFFPPELASDPLQRGVILRDVGNILAGQPTGEPSPALRDAAANYHQYLHMGPARRDGARHRPRSDPLRRRAVPHQSGVPRPKHVRAVRYRRADAVRAGRDPDNDRHRLLRRLGDLSVLLRSRAERTSNGQPVPVRHRMESAGGAARRPGRHQDGVRLHPAADRHAADHDHRHHRRRTAGSVLGDLSLRVRDATLSCLCQADPGDPGRHPDGRARLLRGLDGGTLHSRLG